MIVGANRYPYLSWYLKSFTSKEVCMLSGLIFLILNLQSFKYRRLSQMNQEELEVYTLGQSHPGWTASVTSRSQEGGGMLWGLRRLDSDARRLHDTWDSTLVKLDIRSAVVLRILLDHCCLSPILLGGFLYQVTNIFLFAYHFQVSSAVRVKPQQLLLVETAECPSFDKVNIILQVQFQCLQIWNLGILYHFCQQLCQQVYEVTLQPVVFKTAQLASPVPHLRQLIDYPLCFGVLDTCFHDNLLAELVLSELLLEVACLLASSVYLKKHCPETLQLPLDGSTTFQAGINVLLNQPSRCDVQDVTEPYLLRIHLSLLVDEQDVGQVWMSALHSNVSSVLQLHKGILTLLYRFRHQVHLIYTLVLEDRLECVVPKLVTEGLLDLSYLIHHVNFPEVQYKRDFVLNGVLDPTLFGVLVVYHILYLLKVKIECLLQFDLVPNTDMTTYRILVLPSSDVATFGSGVLVLTKTELLVV